MSAPQESWYPDLWDHSGASGSFSSNAALLSILNFKLEQRLILKTVIARRAAAHQVAALPVAEGAGHVLACSADHGDRWLALGRLPRCSRATQRTRRYRSIRLCAKGPTWPKISTLTFRHALLNRAYAGRRICPIPWLFLRRLPYRLAAQMTPPERDSLLHVVRTQLLGAWPAG